MRSGNDRSRFHRRQNKRPALESLEGRRLMSLGSEFPVTTTTSGAQFDSDVAKSRGGSWVAVWTDSSSSSDHVIRAQRFDRLDHRTGPEIVVAHIGDSSAAGDPSVAMGPTGNFVVSWTQTGTGGDTNVLARQYSANGTSRGGSVQVGVGTFREHDSDAAIDDSGRFTVSYTRDTNNTNPDIFARRYDTNGHPLNVLKVAVSSKAESHSSVAVAPDGRISVVYELHSSATNDDIRLNRFASNGSQMGSLTIAGTPARERAPSVSVDNSGNAVVAYQKLVQHDYDIMARRLSSGGTLSSELEIRSTGDQETTPSVALKRGGGGFVVAYNSSGKVLVSEVLASNTVWITWGASSSRSNPAVAIDGSNHYLVTFTTNDAQPSSSSLDRNIRAQSGRLA